MLVLAVGLLACWLAGLLADSRIGVLADWRAGSAEGAELWAS